MKMRTTFAILCMAVSLRAQGPAPQEKSAGAVVSYFCQVDTAGKRLSVPGAKDVAKTLLLDERPWEQPSEIVIVKDYSVRPLGSERSLSEFAADYRVLGRLDSALMLTRLQMPYTAQPSMQSEHFSLVLTDTHSEIGPDGKPHQMKGSTEWRIKSYPSQPHVGINAAIAYIRMMGYRAKDVRMRMNSEKTFSELQEMLSGLSMPPQLAEPKTIVSQFVELQMGGLGVQPETVGQMSAFLAHAESQHTGKIGVATAYAIKKTTFASNKATVSVEYEAIGEIDSQLRFTSLGLNRTVVQRDYKLLLDNKYSVPPKGGKPSTEFAGPSRWRIEEAPPEQWVSVATAINYGTQMRNASRDSSIRENADKTLAILRGLR